MAAGSEDCFLELRSHEQRFVAASLVKGGGYGLEPAGGTWVRSQICLVHSTATLCLPAAHYTNEALDLHRHSTAPESFNTFDLRFAFSLLTNLECICCSICILWGSYPSSAWLTAPDGQQGIACSGLSLTAPRSSCYGTNSASRGVSRIILNF